MLYVATLFLQCSILNIEQWIFATNRGFLTYFSSIGFRFSSRRNANISRCRHIYEVDTISSVIFMTLFVCKWDEW